MSEIVRFGENEDAGQSLKLAAVAKVAAEAVLTSVLAVADVASRFTQLPIVRDYLGWKPRDYS